MKISLCGQGSWPSCPAVEVGSNEVTIGEDDNTVRLKPSEWNRMIDLVKEGKLKKV